MNILESLEVLSSLDKTMLDPYSEAMVTIGQPSIAPKIFLHGIEA